jgi:hypothetical protein
MKLMTDNYSQWFNYHVKKRTGKRIKAEHGESSPDLSEDVLPSVQKRGGNPDQDLEADRPKKRARTAQPEPITENNEAVSFFLYLTLANLPIYRYLIYHNTLHLTVSQHHHHAPTKAKIKKSLPLR